MKQTRPTSSVSSNDSAIGVGPRFAVGERFTRLVIVARLEDRNKNQRYLCRCDCGVMTESWRSQLAVGHKKSCGCLKRDTAAISIALARAARMAKSHEKTKHPLYTTWKCMTERCRDQSNEDYGGRGIRVSSRWLGPDGFRHFTADMGPKPSPKHSIDRVDVNGNYEPSNCRWATAQEQRANQRRHIPVPGIASMAMFL